MDSRNRAISQSRSKTGTNPSPKSKDLASAQEDHAFIHESTVNFLNVSSIANIDDLNNTIKNHIKQHGNTSDDINITQIDANHIQCTMQEKNLALSLAKAVQAAFKVGEPDMQMRNPDNNEFYRIDVTFK